ncbi:MAG: type II secretion system protein GspK [Pseudomonadota bacterium]
MRRPDDGVVLVNVLVVLALSSAVLLAMIRVGDIGISRSQTFADAAQGRALIAGGEASAITALRRDMGDAPQTDHPGEPWASANQAEVRIDAGTFALTISDAQARFNLNSIAASGAIGPQILVRITQGLNLPETVAPRILARIGQVRPLRQIDDLVAEAGLTPAEVDALRPLITVLPQRTDVNLNTAPEALLVALTDTAVQAGAITALRDRRGFLTPADLAAAEVVLLPGVGFASQYFEVVVQVTVGRVTQSQRSLLHRRQDADGQPAVAVVARLP